MTDDLDFQESLDRYFEIEAAELLQTIEQTLFQLVEEKTIERVHTLMRSAHTIKGSAANCGFKTIETIAHHLEDVFQALYPAELEIDAELGLLLVEGYQCLSDPLSAMLAGIPYDEAATLERTAELFARLQTHLGDFFGRDTPLPTAADLGFDVVGSIFTDSVPQDLEVLAAAIAGQNVDKVRESLSALAEFLLELGGSYSLPGIEAIARTTLTALQRNPDQVLEIAQAALTNFQQAQIAIVGGDRSVGGEVSLALIAWAEIDRSVAPPLEPQLNHNEAAEWMSLVDTNLNNDPDKWTDDRLQNQQCFPNPQSPIPNPQWYDSNSLESDAPISADRASSADWLSLIDSSDAVDDNSQTSEDWLSLVDTDRVEPDTTTIATEPQVDDNIQTAQDWLSLVDTDRAEPDTTSIATEPQVDDNGQTAQDWLSLVDTSNDKTEIETDRSIGDNLVEPVDLEPEVVEFEVFEPEVINLNTSDLMPTEYEPQTGSDLMLTNISGIDRIFQSISIGHSSSFAAEELQQTETAPAQETKESAPDALVSIRIATVQLERLSHTMGELLIDDNQQYLRTEQLHRLAKSTVEQHRRCQQKLRLVGDWADKNTLTGDRPQFSQQRGRKAKKAAKKVANEVQSQFDSIELDVYTDLSILLQDLTDDLANLGMQVEDLAEMTQKAKLTLGKRKQLLVDAQAELFDARMVEISTVFNRFPRLLQQMVAAHRKPAQLELIGTTVSIDKIIADKLYDPLLHLIRNAYDHGVEPPEIRAQQGKSETGTLTIKAYHQGNRTTIEVSDDGQGLNFTKIRQRAIDLHLLEAHRASSVTEAELSEIMFAPGFSTADRVNDLSGRGIGLDVVRDRIGALQGTIDVRSISGRGTTFILQFPLNLSTARLLICESQGVVHALRSEAIGQVLLPSPDRIQSQSSLTDNRVTNFLRWGEGSTQKLIPIYPINDLLDYHCPTISGSASIENLFPANIKNSTNALLLLEIDDDRICLEVNRILVEQELVVKSLGQTFGLPNYIQGYSVLGDGSLTLAIDPVELLAPVRNTRATPKFGTSPLAALPPLLSAAVDPTEDAIIEGEILDTSARTPARNSTMLGKQIQVLIVDDSLVQRQTLTRALTKAGCQVIQASHGREGILRLQEHPRIRLVVCDIEMPQMNGFEFLSHCRQDPKLSQIPIVMLTTRGGQKHRQLAMTLGAKDYLTKPQSERDLLDIVAKLSQPNEVGV